MQTAGCVLLNNERVAGTRPFAAARFGRNAELPLFAIDFERHAILASFGQLARLRRLPLPAEGAVEVDLVDFLPRHKSLDIDRMGAFQGHFVEFFGIEQHTGAVSRLVAWRGPPAEPLPRFQRLLAYTVRGYLYPD
jgi:hypothetical protein